MKKDSLGDRMKNNYEKVYNIKLPKRLPTIIRIDGKAFHTLTKKMEKPFDFHFIDCMNETAQYLCTNIQNAQMAYIQSDEISILLHNYKKLETQSWFNNEIQKMTSISAGMASAFFTSIFNEKFSPLAKLGAKNYKVTVFDSRVFVLPEAEVVNYFVWRQNDWTRNSVQMFARSLYSHKECHKKNNNELQEMLHQKGQNWNDLEISLKRGRCCIKDQYAGWTIEEEIPIFTQDRKYIEKFLTVEKE